MIKRLLVRPQTYLILFFFLLFVLPKKGANHLRRFAIGTVAPSWHLLQRAKVATQSFFTTTRIDTKQVEQLKIENQRLKQQIDRYNTWLVSEERLNEEYEKLKEISGEEALEFFQRRSHYLQAFLKSRLKAFPAQVIFREPSLWNSILWLDVGERENQGIGASIIAKNSPVVVGRFVVGVVEDVYETKCRIRLITDQKLTPSVRAVRRGEQDRLLLSQIERLIDLLFTREDLENKEELLENLVDFSQNFDPTLPTSYLAKGELHGSSGPHWRTLKPTLKGVGFNYDFSDDEGPSRDLRGGSGEALIKVGDLLVTTGMDGVFPADLRVGIVNKIFPLQEGGVGYSLEATPLVPNLNELTEVFILPPQ